jgi:threonine efflux protein
MLSTLVTIWLLHVAALLSPGANVLLVSQLAASDHARSARYAGTLGLGLLLATLREARA